MGTGREEDSILRQVAFEELEDNQGTSTGPVDMARGKGQGTQMWLRGEDNYLNSLADSALFG